MRNLLVHDKEEELSVRGFLVLICLAVVVAVVCSLLYMAYMPPEPGPWQRPAVDPTQSVFDKGGR